MGGPVARDQWVPSFSIFFAARALDSPSPCDHEHRAVLVVHWEECLGCVRWVGYTVAVMRPILRISYLVTGIQCIILGVA